MARMANAAGDGTLPTYTLISSSDSEFDKSFLHGNSVVSSSLFANQFQTGSVDGVLARDLHSLYGPVSSNQHSTMANTRIIDESFYNLAWAQPGAWPLMDTPGHLGAYRYLSYWTVYAASNDHVKADDIRTLYPTSSNADIAGKDPTQAPYPSNGTWQDPIDGKTYKFTSSEMSDVARQLKNELFDLKVVSNYMYVSNGGLKDVLVTNGSSGIVYTLLSAAGAAVTDLNQEQSSTTVNVNLSSLVGLTGAIVAVAAFFVDPADVVIFSFGGAVLRAAGSMGAVLNPSSKALPSPYVTIALDVATLSNQISVYLQNIASNFDSAMDNINTDWSKLNQVAINTGINGKWQIPSASSYQNLPQLFQQAAKTYFYTQIFASLYSVDFYKAQPSYANEPWLIGSGQYRGEYPYVQEVCTALYPNTSKSTNSQPFAVYPTPGYFPELNDIFYIGGEITKNNGGNMTEKYPSTAYINTMFGTDIKTSNDLDLNFDQFWTPNGPLNRRTGDKLPSFGGRSCWHIGAVIGY